MVYLYDCFVSKNLGQEGKKLWSKKQGRQRKKKEKSEKTIDVNFDPVTYLTQLLQLRKEPSAVYSFLGELGSKLDKKFQIEVSRSFALLCAIKIELFLDFKLIVIS